MSGRRAYTASAASAAAEAPDWVARGGIATAEQLIRGAAEHLGVPGLFGFSVQRQRGKTVADLAFAGRFPRAQISVATIDHLVAVAGECGYREVRIVASPGRGFHHTAFVPEPLPLDLAAALSRAFTVQPNPARAAVD